MADNEEKVVSESEEKEKGEEEKDESTPNANADAKEETSKPDLNTDVKEETNALDSSATNHISSSKSKLPDEKVEAPSVVQPLLTGIVIEVS